MRSTLGGGVVEGWSCAATRAASTRMLATSSPLIFMEATSSVAKGPSEREKTDERTLPRGQGRVNEHFIFKTKRRSGSGWMTVARSHSSHCGARVNVRK